MDRVWRATVHRVTKSPTRLSDLAIIQVTIELLHLPFRDLMRNKKDTLVREPTKGFLLSSLLYFPVKEPHL